MALDEFLRGYRTLARRNPYGSLGPSPATVRRVTPPPQRKPPPPPPPYDPYADARQSTAAMIESILAQVQAQQDAARQQAEQEAQQEIIRGQALAQGLQQLGISQAIQQAFQGAGQSQAALAQGFSGAIRDQASADAAAQQHLLSGTGQEGAVRNQGENMGNVTYGVGGAIPASSLNTAGAAFGAQAALQPGFAQQFGQIASQQRLSDYTQNELPDFLNQRLDVLSKQPDIFQDFLDTALKRQESMQPAGPDLVKSTLANGQIQWFDKNTGKPVGPPRGPARVASSSSNKVTYRSLANGQIQRFDADGNPMGKPIGPPRAASKKAKSKGYNLQFKDLGGYHQWVDPRSGKPVGQKYRDPKTATEKRAQQPKQKFTASQLASMKADAYDSAKAAKFGLKNSDGTWKLPPQGEEGALTPQQVLQDLVGHGIPFRIAVREVAKFFPAAKKWYDPSKTFKNTTKNVSYKVEASGKGFNSKTGSVQLPASFSGTHVTDGLGWGTKTAHDFMAPAGSPVESPVSGTVLYFHPTGAQGGGSMLIRGDDGYEYWLGHIQDGMASGRVEAGQPIAVVAFQNVSAPHVHIDRRRFGATI